MAGPAAMFRPAGRPASMYGRRGGAAQPAQTATCGMLADARAARVKRAGVGLPSGVAGTADGPGSDGQYP